MHQLRISRNRASKGGAIAEFGPALFIALFILFWPMLNLIVVCLTYADTAYLHFLLQRQAGLENVLVRDVGGNLVANPAFGSADALVIPSLNQIINNWRSSGLGVFASSSTAPTQIASYNSSEGAGSTQFVHVKLTVTCKPFLNVPFWTKVPGLNAPIPFVFSGRSVIEYVPN